ncbi:SusC/RagA family TonB-linked outer membrane protein [Ekhidna sp.]|uniref:SusC/RagA family TonB-linked outer membrane protein n=1 Tax=Ekhidna sp. TaxID=2608089 RepID=UPI003B5046FE
MKRILLLTVMFSLAVITVMAQRTVSGKVSDDSGEALPGVNVVIKGTTTGVTTDLDGNYRISVEDGATLVFSYVGFESQEVAVGSRTTLDITMGGATELQEVVVTALGVERSEKALGYAVQEVGNQEIVNSGAVSAVDALVGKAAGIQITRSSGSAGGGSRILLRGITSIIGNNQPIIVIDGVRTNNETIGGTEANTAGTAQSNRLMDLNVNDIENVSVLKGAAATALYGTAGSTGVIVITTKKGQKGAGLSVNFTHQTAFDKVTTAPSLQSTFAQGTAGTYRDPSTGYFASWGPRISSLQYSNDPNHPEAPTNSNAFDADGNYKWDKNGFLVSSGGSAPANTYDNLGDFYNTGVTNTSSISISGGNEVATFRFSGSNHDQQGIIPNEEYLRKTASVASTLKASDALSFSATINYTRSDHTRIQQGSNTSGLLLGLYRTPASFDNSNGFGNDAYNQPSSYIFPDGQQRNYRGGGGYDNPYWVVNNALRFETVHRTFGNFQTNYKVSDWVNFGMNIGTDITNDDRKQEFEINSRTNPNGTIILDEYITRQTDFYLNLSGQGQLNDDFSLNYLVGLNMFSYNRHNTYTQGDGLVFGGFRDISNATSISAQEDDTRYRTLGIFGQVETSWRNTAFVTLTARQDYDSRLVNPAEFDASAAGFFYPSISTALAFSELMPSNDVLSFGKVRFSWAQVGAPPPNAYSTSSVYENVGVGDGWGTTIPWPINGVTSFERDNLLGNPGLTPELTTQTEIGLDLRFFDGKIGLDLAYYTQTTEDAILPASVSPESGYTSAWLNAGKLSSDGIEITLNATPVSSGDFNWDTQVNWSTTETIVDELAPGIESVFLAGFNSAGSYAIVGQPYGGIRGGAYLREGAATHPDGDLSLPSGAVVINDDVNSSEYGFQAVDPVQRAIGNPIPDFILGWRNSITYKNVSLGALLDWREGGDLWNGTQWALSFFGRSALTAQTREESPFAIPGVLSDGSPNNIEIVRDQSYWQSSLGGFGAVGEQFVEDGGWIRLRELSVNYQLPGAWFANNIVKNASVGFVGRNLWYDWEYDGVDPETSLTGTGNGQGFDYFNNPSTRTFMFKLSVNF